MTAVKILLIEDKKHRNNDTVNLLKDFGHEVMRLEYSGANTLKKAGGLDPELILFDIDFENENNWMKIADQFLKNYNIPIIFIAGSMHKANLEKIDSTDLYSFVKKPFSKEELRYLIELAVTKQSLQQKLIEEHAWITTTLRSIGDAVITTDVKGQISFMNPVAEKLTGWQLDEALGKDLITVFQIINERTGEHIENPVNRILQEGIILELANHTVLISKDGKHIPIDDSGAPIKDDQGNILGVVLVFRDITERRKVEAALAKERDLLSALMDNSPDHIFFKDSNSQFMRVSKAMADVFGIENPQDVEGKTDFDFFAEKYAQSVVQDEQNIMKSGIPIVGIEEKETWSDGSETWVSTTKVPFYNEKGEIIGTLGISRDITEHRKAEIALEHEKVLMDAMMNNFPEYIYFKDLNSRFFRISKVLATDVFGLDDPKEAIGKSDFDYFPLEHAQKEFDNEQKIIESGKPIIDDEVKTEWADGSVSWASTTKMLLRDEKGKIIGTFGITKNITEHKKAEIALEHEKVLMDAMMNNFPEYIYFKDLNSRFYRISKVLATDVFGLDDPKEAIGKSDFDFFPPEHAQEDFDNEQRIIKTGKPIIDDEVKTEWADGSVSWASTTKMPLCDENGKTIGIFGISRNITDRKQTEEALKYEKSLIDALMNYIPDSIYFKDSECRLTKVSRTMIENLGFDDDSQIIGKTDIELFGEEFGKDTVRRDKKQMQSGEKVICLIEERKLENGESNWTSTSKVPIYDEKGKIMGLVGITREINEIKKAEQERDRMIFDLQQALNKVNTLQGLIPICANCKKIRNDEGYYEQVEKYIMDHSGAVFSHGICPECMAKLYPDFSKKLKKKT